MTFCVQHLLDCLNLDSPFSLAESWDNVGLLIGNQETPVTSILIGLDPTNALIDEAISLGANTVITHHPIIFRPLPRINTAEPEGILLQKVITNNIAILACHTNLDCAADGVSDALARDLGLSDLRPLIPTAGESCTTTGLGRIGRYQQPLAGSAFFSQMLTALAMPAVLVAGPVPEQVSTVAVCGGSGSDFAEQAFRMGADIYLSSEIKHHTARWTEERKFCIIDGTHYGTEQPAIRLLASKIQAACRALNQDVSIHTTTTEKPPLILRGSDSNQATRAKEKTL